MQEVLGGADTKERHDQRYADKRIEDLGTAALTIRPQDILFMLFPLGYAKNIWFMQAESSSAQDQAHGSLHHSDTEQTSDPPHDLRQCSVIWGEFIANAVVIVTAEFTPR